MRLILLLQFEQANFSLSGRVRPATSFSYLVASFFFALVTERELFHYIYTVICYTVCIAVIKKLKH